MVEIVVFDTSDPYVSAEVRGQLALQRGLYDQLRRLDEQPTLTIDRNTLSVGTAHELLNQRPIPRRPQP